MAELQEAVEQPKVGSFVESLRRNGKQIREDRAISLGEDAETAYRRSIEDLKFAIKKVARKRDLALDMSPDNTYSIISGRDFNGTDFYNNDLNIGLELRELEIRLEIAEKRYQQLFG